MTFFNTGTRRVFRLFLSSLVWVMLPDAIAQTGPLTIVKSGSGTGTVTTTPAGIDCGVTCTASLSSFTLHAAPDPGSIFSGWVDAPCSGTGDCTINAMPNPRTIKAVFSAGTVVLTVQSNEFFFASGVVTSSPGEISCGFVCVYAFPAGTTVTLTATPRPGSQLAGWFGNGVNCPGTET